MRRRKKRLRSRIRSLTCPVLGLEERISSKPDALRQNHINGFNWAVLRVLVYMDHYAPLQQMLFAFVEELRKKRVSEIHGDGQASTIVTNAGFILACNQILKLVYEEHADEIEWARAIERAEDSETI